MILRLDSCCRWATTALLLLTPVLAVELEVRATQSKAPVADLSAEEFRLRHNGDELPLDSATYVDDIQGTKIYVAVQVPGTQFARVLQAIEQFLAELPEGVEVSLGGTPFTADREQLQEYLSTGAKLDSATPSGGLIRLWAAEGNIQLQGRPVLNTYRALAAQLGQLPGRKAVALFRPSLRLISDGLDTRDTEIRTQTIRQNDADVTRNQQVLEEMVSQAILARAPFYTAVVADSVSGGANIGAGGITERSSNQPLGSDFGLTSIAELSGGQAIPGGEPARLFELILEDSRDYYVLEYSPELKGDGKRVNLRVDSNRKGVNVRSVRRYLDIPAPEMPEQTQDVLGLDPAGAELTLTSEVGYVRGPFGQPRVIFTAGIPVNQLEAEDAKKGVTADLTLGGGVPGSGGEFLVKETTRTQQVFDRKAFAQAQKNPSILVDLSSMVDLESPGTHPWKMVVRDETSGRYGASTFAPGAPDFSLPLATSTMFLSRRAIEIKPDTPQPPWGDALDFGPSRIVPEATRTFRTGETVLFTYTLYNPTPDMLQTPPPVQIALLQNEQQIESFEVDAQNMIDPANKTIRYVGGLKTKGLPPAEYIILSAVPGRDDARQPYVEAKFTLVK